MVAPSMVGMGMSSQSLVSMRSVSNEMQALSSAATSDALGLSESTKSGIKNILNQVQDMVSDDNSGEGDALVGAIDLFATLAKFSASNPDFYQSAQTTFGRCLSDSFSSAFGSDHATAKKLIDTLQGLSSDKSTQFYEGLLAGILEGGIEGTDELAAAITILRLLGKNAKLSVVKEFQKDLQDFVDQTLNKIMQSDNPNAKSEAQNFMAMVQNALKGLEVDVKISFNKMEGLTDMADTADSDSLSKSQQGQLQIKSMADTAQPEAVQAVDQADVSLDTGISSTRFTAAAVGDPTTKKTVTDTEVFSGASAVSGPSGVTASASSSDSGSSSDDPERGANKQEIIDYLSSFDQSLDDRKAAFISAILSTLMTPIHARLDFMTQKSTDAMDQILSKIDRSTAASA
ncbi:MAG: hypothetical protein AB7F28_02290 [Candidatus Margulisiibacteriota bacterium]